MDDALVDHWKRVLSTLDPLRPLRPDETPALYIERPDDPTRGIRQQLITAPLPGRLKILVYGARGAGKSSALSRLAHDTSDRFFPIRVDLAAGLPEKTSTLGIIALLGFAVLRVRDGALPDGTVPAPQTSPGKDRLAAALDRFGMAADTFGRVLAAMSPLLMAIGAPPVAPVLAVAGAASSEVFAKAAEVRQALSRGEFAGALPPEKQQDAHELIAAVNVILDELSARTGLPPLLLADGFDKETRLENVKDAFADAELLLGLGCPVVLAGPVVLRHEPSFNSLPFHLQSLPNVSVCKRVDGDVVDDPHGIELFRLILGTRLAPLHLVGDALVDDAALVLAARTSSGIVREFLNLIEQSANAAFAVGKDRIGVDEMNVAVRRQRLNLQARLREADYAVLARILAKPHVLPSDERTDVLLYQNLIACYANGGLWYRPHEAIVDAVQRAIEEDEAADGG